MSSCCGSHFNKLIWSFFNLPTGHWINDGPASSTCTNSPLRVLKQDLTPTEHAARSGRLFSISSLSEYSDCWRDFNTTMTSTRRCAFQDVDVLKDVLRTFGLASQMTRLQRSLAPGGDQSLTMCSCGVTKQTKSTLPLTISPGSTQTVSRSSPHPA